jgi:inner membrane protein
MEQQPVSNNSTSFFSQYHLWFKMIFTFFLILILMIPLSMIRSLIQERASLQMSVGQSVAESWGAEQSIYGPVLCIPYKQDDVGADKKIYQSEHLLFVAPETLAINSGLQSEVRTKGIFNTVVFTGRHTLKGEFSIEHLPNPQERHYQLDKAKMLTWLSDPSSITDQVVSQWSGGAQKTVPGIGVEGMLRTGFHIAAPLNNGVKIYTFEQQLVARGTTALRFIPSGRTTDIDVSSNWPSPSFLGKNLPTSRQINSEGFTAHWDANEYNRPFGDFWEDNGFSFGDNVQNAFGVELIQTADFYQKNERSVKYAMLIIALSFVVFFFFEMLLGIRLHPIQYILIGLSLVIFYALLLAFTEHIGFNSAYGFSCLAVISLIAVYAYSIVKRTGLVLMLTGLFATLYGYVFVLLQLEDYALLAGTIGLFVILATIMLLSRKVDWYKLGSNRADIAKEP